MAVGINSGLLLNRLIIVNAAKKRKVKKKKKRTEKTFGSDCTRAGEEEEREVQEGGVRFQHSFNRDYS